MAVANNSPLGEMLTYGTRKRSRRSTGLLIGGSVVGLGLIALVLWPSQQISQRPHDMKTTRVVLPPPPPPPPPEAKPVEQPPEPRPMPLEKPVDSPPPPDQANSDPTPGDSALTAREGAGPSSYGLAVGNGSGTMIGSRAGSGDNGFGAYASLATSAIRLAAQSDRDLARGRYTVRLVVAVDAEGRITDVRVVDGSGDSRRDEKLRQVLTGLRLSKRPPPGLPVMRIELNSRPGA